MIRFFICTVVLVLVLNQNLAAQHTNILISDSNSPDEPSICINALNTDELVAGANLNNVYYSHDGGYSWTNETLICPEYSVWGDPSIACDANGDFYFFHLSNPQNGIWIDRIVCQKSTDAGVNWNDGSFTGLNLPKQQDKQWPAIDRSTNTIFLSWTEFDDYGSSSVQDSSRILFSKSTDGGNIWTNPLKINRKSGDCIDSDNTAEGATPCIGPNGEVYVAWSFNDTIYFDRSTNGGSSWIGDDIVVSDQPGGWDYSIPGISRCNGLPITACDTTGGANNGAIYVNWTDHRNGQNNTDVFVAKSTDGGNNWDTPKKINDDDSGNEQFFTWMTIDQATGYVWFVFYDRRNYVGNSVQTDVYGAVSLDGCETFINFKISESPFEPDADIFFGDYTNITAYNNVVRPIWTRLHDGQKSIHTAIIDTELLTVNITEMPSIELLEQNFPNPAREITYVSFKIHQHADVSLVLMDVSGRVVAAPINHESFSYGKYTIPINVNDLKLEPGIYYYQFTTEKEQVSRKMIVVN